MHLHRRLGRSIFIVITSVVLLSACKEPSSSSSGETIISKTQPKVTTFVKSNEAVVYSVPSSGANKGKNVITVRVTKSNINGVETQEQKSLKDSDLAYYVLYVKKSDTEKKPATVRDLWSLKDKNNKRIARYKYKKGIETNTNSISIQIVESATTPIAEKTDYYIGVSVVNTTSKEYKADDPTKLFLSSYYSDIAIIKEIYTSLASFSIAFSNRSIRKNVGDAIMSVTFTKDPTDATFSCNGTLIDNLQKETGLVFNKNKNIAIEGTPNKSNIHDSAITEYVYEIICTGTGSHTGIAKANITVEIGLKNPPAGETAADYYRPKNKTELKAIITAEKGASRQSTNSPNLNMIDTSAITNMSSLFRFDSRFNGDISNWDTSKVTSMFGMFTGATGFNGDISDWNVSNVTDMENMFLNADKFNQDLNNWKTGKVVDMSYMFANNDGFNGDISDWDVSNVTDMTSMFQYAVKFNRDLNNWNTSRVTTMRAMFSFARVFNGNISNWDTSKVTSMVGMFNAAINFNKDLNWDTSKVTDMFGMFTKAYKFNGNISNWNTSKVTRMNAMFQDTRVFNRNISNWNTSKVTETVGMFHRANTFNQNISNWKLPALKKPYFMFWNATAFDQDLSSWKLCNSEEENLFKNSAMDGKTAQYPKFKGDAACSS